MIRALTLSFFTGLIEILAGLLNLGSLINFISAPVISAFTSAVSIQVATSQVKGLLGLKVKTKAEFTCPKRTDCPLNVSLEKLFFHLNSMKTKKFLMTHLTDGPSVKGR